MITPMSRDNLLMVADSEHNADMLYAVGMFVPDPFIFLALGRRPVIVLPDLEVDRARRLARHCRILSLSRCVRRLERSGRHQPDIAEVIQQVLQAHRRRKVLVSPAFPHGIAQRLRRLHIKVKVKKGPFLPQREIKRADEIKKISAALTMAEVGLAEAIQVIRSSKIARNGRLQYRNLPLTSERLRTVIEVAILQAGGFAAHTIVAGGAQASEPHEHGHGALRAHQPIIIDVFPRSQKTGYCGDITRTIVRGRASEAVRRLYHAVSRAQSLALSLLRSHTPCEMVHRSVQEFFSSEGYKTGRHNGRLQGFFHGLGHGLGLEIHESPRIGPGSADTLLPGHVVTVEPGLYYPDVGSVRLEDVALITHSNPRNLTKFEKVLEV